MTADQDLPEGAEVGEASEEAALESAEPSFEAEHAVAEAAGSKAAEEAAEQPAGAGGPKSASEHEPRRIHRLATRAEGALDEDLGPLGVRVRNRLGEVLRELSLDPYYFGVEPNVPVLHQVVTAQLAARRRGTHSTLRRGEVRGGGAKPYRQKGTGRARQGSIRAPHWVGGAIAMGPKPRSYRQRVPKKMISLALRSALSDRALLNRVVVVDAWNFGEPSTKKALASLAALGCNGKVGVVLSREDFSARRSFANLPEVQVIDRGELSAYDVLRNDWIVFTEATLPARQVEAEAS
jgi:large subunit ribosomal protein L4